jgi:hypothetical protein
MRQGFLGGKLNKPSGTLLNRLESLVGLGRDFAKMVLFQCSGGFRSLRQNPRKHTTTYYNVIENIPAFYIIIIELCNFIYIYPCKLLILLAFVLFQASRTLRNNWNFIKPRASSISGFARPPRTH